MKLKLKNFIKVALFYFYFFSWKPWFHEYKTEKSLEWHISFLDEIKNTRTDLSELKIWYLYVYKLIFFPLHQPVTKNQNETSNVSRRFLLHCHNFKREQARLSLLFSNRINIKKCQLTFGVSYLVISQWLMQ